MESETVIKVNNVRKSFKVYKDRGYMLKEMVLFANRRKYEVHEVLKGVSFQVGKGEAVGLIGQNGCGKSTTLKLLTKIIYPDSGSIEMKGRVSSLLELGAGFHPDMKIFISMQQFLDLPEMRLRRDSMILSLFRSWRIISIILSEHTHRECICGLLFRWQSMLMRIYC